MIVSQIRVGLLLSSDNNYLRYPCLVVVHVMEIGDGCISNCTVNDGNGAYVTAKNFKFDTITDPINETYQKFFVGDVLKKYTLKLKLEALLK